MWIGTIELSYANSKAPTVRKKAFTVVATWAGSTDEFTEKCSRMLEDHGWHLLGVEKAVPVSLLQDFSEEVRDLIKRITLDPNATIHGTFYTYPVT